DLDPKLVTLVTERVSGALHNHLEDTTQQFEKWFLGSKNSFVHQIAKQRRSRGGQLDDDTVREVLLHLGWTAYGYMSNCLSAQMQTVARALPEPLTTEERAVFAQMHLPQLYFGNLPLVLVIERFGTIKDVLWEVWERLPDTAPIAVLHRLLDYYS